MQDPKGNRIAQWLNVTPVGGIADLSFPLAAEAPAGEYTIKTPDCTQSFRVEEYGKSLRELMAAAADVLSPDPPSYTELNGPHSCQQPC